MYAFLFCRNGIVMNLKELADNCANEGSNIKFSKNAKEYPSHQDEPFCHTINDNQKSQDRDGIAIRYMQTSFVLGHSWLKKFISKHVHLEYKKSVAAVQDHAC